MLQKKYLQRVLSIIKENGLNVVEGSDKPFEPTASESIIFVASDDIEKLRELAVCINREFPYDFQFVKYVPMSGDMNRLTLGIIPVDFVFGMMT